ncbi:LysR family transcriptional regulator [Pseudoalteromonas piscicida]|uniref:Transcriptional regulator n=1 Tax=Pseudoalteromonas piscicida TaxID=43662 RepID=A0A2A5JP13_PSEO7|nr:LysR family transcriptional regulator [Pseudoalteromonas piscicida]PCK31176.1 transcriptional regulator [Pseudoalteromonas piscicida]
MSTINLNALKLLAIFATVVDTGSFSQAARKLATSRSRVSEQISHLEEMLGVRLLQRSTRQLTLTREGRDILAQAHSLHAILDDIEVVLDNKDPHGMVSITMTHDIAHKFLLPKLAELTARYPKIQLNIIVDDDKRDIINDQIDLALRVGFPKDSSLVARQLHQERFKLYASPRLINQYGLPAGEAQLNQLPWLLLEQAKVTGMTQLYRDGIAVNLAPNQVHWCNSPMLLQQMAVAGLGVAQLLPSTVKQEVGRGELQMICPTLSSEQLVFSLVYPSRKQIPPRTRAVIDFLLEAELFN